MRTTSAVITSPARISARCSDSSNRSAKDSDIQFPCAPHRFPAVNAGSRTAVAMTGTAVVCGIAPRVTLMNQTACALARGRDRLGLSAKLLLLASSRTAGAERLSLVPPPEHLIDRCFDRAVGVIQQEGVLGGFQGGNGSRRVAGIACLQVRAKSVDCSWN